MLPKDEKVFYYPNPGNAGDSLIACATYQLFERIHLKYEVIDEASSIPDGSTIVYGGGGNLVPYYRGARNVLSWFHKKAKRLILLPHTVAGHEDFLGSLGENVEIFCREEVSYKYVQAKALRAKVMLADDMAFSLDVPTLLRTTQPSPMKMLLEGLCGRRGARETPTMRSLFYYAKEKALHALLNSGNRFVLNAFRQDKEKTEHHIPANNIDASVVFAFGSRSKEIAEFASFHFLKFIDLFRVVHTNRLHCAIGAALLGKEVYLYPNNYYKVEEVWRFSIKDKFQNVYWVGDSQGKELWRRKNPLSNE